MVKKQFLIFLVLLISGCSTLPETIEPNEAKNYQSIDQLVSDTTGFNFEVAFESIDYVKVLQPFSYAVDYCSAHGGELNIIETYKRPLNTPHPTPKQDRLLKQAFGFYECMKNKQVLWGIEVKHSATDAMSYYQDDTFDISIETFDPQSLQNYKDEKRKKEEERELAYKRWKKDLPNELAKQRRLREENEALIKLKAEKQRNQAKLMLSKQSNIGRKICKNGELRYSYYSGTVILNQPYYQDVSEEGQLVAFLENFSDDGNRVQIRMAGWATPTARLKHNPAHHPKMGLLGSEPGVVYWDDVKDWFICN